MKVFEKLQVHRICLWHIKLPLSIDLAFFFLLSFSFCLCVISNDSLRHLLILNKCNSYSSDHFALAPFNFNTKIKHAPIWYCDANVVVLISHMLNHLMRWRASAIVFVYVYICRNTINIEKEMANCITAVLWLSLPFCLSFFFLFLATHRHTASTWVLTLEIWNV